MLSADLRALLGMREAEPPPFLARMQQLGYPPGYLADPHAAQATEPCLQLFEAPPPEKRPRHADADDAAASAAGAARAVPSVDFPGLNVPPPHDANPGAWGWRGPITRPGTRR